MLLSRSSPVITHTLSFSLAYFILSLFPSSLHMSEIKVNHGYEMLYLINVSILTILSVKLKNINKIPPAQPTGKLPFSDPEATFSRFHFLYHANWSASIMLNAPIDLTSKRFLPTTAYMFVEAIYKKQMTKTLLENIS
jgi:hypothetical protein